MYPQEMLDVNRYMEANQCPENDRLCEEVVWLFQHLLLAGKTEMDNIANAIEKIRKNADKLVSLNR